MKKSIVIVLISAGIISIVTSLSYRLQSKETHQASARISLDPGVGTGFIYYPNFLQDQIQAISNHLCQPDNRMTLARQSNVDEKDFCLITVGPVNGTRLLDARFTGYESNTSDVCRLECGPDAGEFLFHQSARMGCAI